MKSILDNNNHDDDDAWMNGCGYPLLSRQQDCWLSYYPDGDMSDRCVSYINVQNLTSLITPDGQPFSPHTPTGDDDGNHHETSSFRLLLFHGTRHSDARNIMRNGIDIERGAQCQDFSDGRGFYLTPDFYDAVTWARERFPIIRPAIVVFRVPTKLISRAHGMDLSVHESHDGSVKLATEKWRDCVSFHLSGKQLGGHRRLRYYGGLEYIAGPTCTNKTGLSGGGGDGGDSCGGGVSDTDRFEPSFDGTDLRWRRRRRRQLCVRGYDLAETVSRHLDSVVFF